MKYQEDSKKARLLLDKASGQIGMIAEVESKCLLLKARLKRAKKDGTITPEFKKDFRRATRQMQSDIATYSRNLHMIYEELERYGIFLDVA